MCNQRIYSKRHARGEPPDFERVSREWPLRVVQFRTLGYPYDTEAFDRWMAKMQTEYDFVEREAYPLSRYGGRKRELRGFNRIEVYEFVPK